MNEMQLTVAELIEILQKCPKGACVVMDEGIAGSVEIFSDTEICITPISNLDLSGLI